MRPFWEMTASFMVLWGSVMFLYARTPQMALASLWVVVCLEACVWMLYGAQCLAWVLFLLHAGFVMGLGMAVAMAKDAPRMHWGYREGVVGGAMASVLWAVCAYGAYQRQPISTDMHEISFAMMADLWGQRYAEVAWMLAGLCLVAAMAGLKLLDGLSKKPIHGHHETIKATDLPRSEPHLEEDV